ncbi:hypothetical protein [Streptantibioticus ferralitis]|uniref:Uncharacterized protein n=1 Tax=Streptantibioticus ferralitis TaxID=236510 RepID=A0ABT5ZC10_9ACTN|nr:hypothetical protein [Streptantibioticus ferralitis]MDF2261386.1 hypothetical protein [Streptantibioticus ferralitis]
MKLPGSSWHRRSIAALVFLAAFPLATATLASASNPSGKHVGGTAPRGVSSADIQIMNRQEVLDKIAGRLTNGLSEFDRAKISGFTEVEVDPVHNRIHLHWKGAVPKTASDILHRLPEGVTADVVPAEYSKAELHAARNRLMHNGSPAVIPSRLTSVPSRITSIAPAVDGSGLEIGYDEGVAKAKQALAGPLAKPTRQAKTLEVKTATERLTGIDTRVSYQPVSPASAAAHPAAKPTAHASPLTSGNTRQFDNSPWYGGAGMRTPGGGICSSGFGVTSNADGTKLLTAAAHCDGTGWQWNTWAGDPSNYIGQSNGLAIHTIDTVGILPDSGATGGYVYDGASDDPTGYSKPVTGWGHNFVGDYLCSSGANSGAHCNIVVQQTDISETGPDGYTRPIVDLATQTDTWATHIASADGDSGGPVFAGINDYTADEARGTISMNKYEMDSCPANIVLQDTSKACYGGLYFVPIYQTLTEMNWSINTG